MDSEHDGAGTELCLRRREQNAIVNMLTMEQIHFLVNKLFTECYEQKAKGRRRKDSLDYPTPYVVLHQGIYWANPFAFSNTKSDGTGYPTIPFLPSQQQRAAMAPKSTSVKSSWVPRLPVHGVIYRWYHGGKPIIGDVSHLRANRLIVTPWELVDEDDVINRSRCACHQEGWYLEKRGDHMRCPHIPLCLEPIAAPSSDFFKEHRMPPGLPIEGSRGQVKTDSIALV